MEHTDKKFAEILEQLSSAAPEVINDMVTYGYVGYGLELLVSILSLIVCFIMIYFGINIRNKSPSSISLVEELHIFACGCSFMLGVVGGIISIFTTIDAIYGLSKVHFAPNLYVFETFWEKLN